MVRMIGYHGLVMHQTLHMIGHGSWDGKIHVVEALHGLME